MIEEIMTEEKSWNNQTTRRMLQIKSANSLVTKSDEEKVTIIIAIILGLLLICGALFYLLARYMRRNVVIDLKELEELRRKAKAKD